MAVEPDAPRHHARELVEQAVPVGTPGRRGRERGEVRLRLRGNCRRDGGGRLRSARPAPRAGRASRAGRSRRSVPARTRAPRSAATSDEDGACGGRDPVLRPQTALGRVLPLLDAGSGKKVDAAHLASIPSPIATASDARSSRVPTASATCTPASGSARRTRTRVRRSSSSARPRSFVVPPVISTVGDRERAGLALVELQRGDQLTRERLQLAGERSACAGETRIVSVRRVGAEVERAHQLAEPRPRSGRARARLRPRGSRRPTRGRA